MKIAWYGWALGLILCLTADSARADLIDAANNLKNPSFESPFLELEEGTESDGCNYQRATPTDWNGGFIDTSPDNNQWSLYHYRPHTSGLKSNDGVFWDPTDGVNGATLIMRGAGVSLAWMYQSLGVVTENDIGKVFVATIDNSTRVSTSDYLGERRISFRTNVTAGRDGNFGELASMNMSSATRVSNANDPWSTLVEHFQPTAEDLGEEIFLVFSVEEENSGYSAQYQFDNVQLSIVPEPSVVCLALTGLLGLLFWGMQRRR